jgi:orc1/cdc6 family replication initiation protein
MPVFDKILKHSESIIKDELVLDYEYLPKIIKYRENEQAYIATCIKSLLEGRQGKNLFITGSSGIGKTAAIRSIILELQEKGLDDQVIPIYINCWKKDTSYKIALEICDQLNYKFVQNRNTDELLKEITKILNKKAAVLFFDEIDRLEDHSILYTLLEDIYKKSVFLITNDKEFLSNLDKRIKSRLTPETLEFRPYNYNEILGILKQRTEYAFYPNVINKETLELLAKQTFELEDLRIGLFLLKESALQAENSSSKIINLEHANNAIKKLCNFKSNSSDNLEIEKKQILSLIRNNPNVKVSDLHKIYQESGGLKAYRTFFRYIEELEQSGLISKEFTKEGSGRSTIVKYGKKLTDF